MKRKSKLLGLALGVALACVCALPAYAEGGYQYKVRVFTGDKGTLVGGGSIDRFNGEYGANKLYSEERFTAQDGYYVQGLRRSGRDRNDSGTASALTWDARAEGDTDYVVSYGIKGDLLTYTVRYVYRDEAGVETEIAPSDTFYANAGDKPVVAYRYVEGYVPQVAAITGTVDHDRANVFTFYYDRVGTVVVDETVYDEGTTVTDGGTTVTELPGITVDGDSGAGGAGGAGNAGAGGVDIGDNDTPQGILDLDEDETPMGNLQLDMDSQSGKRVGLFGAIAGGLVAVAGLGWLLWFLLIGRKRDKDDKEAKA